MANVLTRLASAVTQWASRRHMRRVMRAYFDVAQTTYANQNHWAQADNLNADAAASASVRQTLRARARYEVANNSLLRGMVLTLAHDLIGPKGPRLQLQTDSRGLNRIVESLWAGWAQEIGLARKLRTMRMARAQDGEAFAMLVTNPRLEGPIKLDLRLVEADRITSPDIGMLEPDNEADGVVFDDQGTPTEYHVLRRHPGGMTAVTALDEFDRVPAEQMLHWFRADRPEQHRGLPDVMPALPILAILRRFSLATLNAAETAAEMALMFATTASAETEAAEVDPWVTLSLERNMAMFAPEGWQPHQLKAEHPTREYKTFRDALINEAARCLSMPFNIAACDSSSYNYSSGRLDHQTYDRACRVERNDCEQMILDRLLTAFLGEAVLVPALGLFGQADRITWPHTWWWDSRRHVDPLKEAKADECRLNAGLMTESAYWAQQAEDWEDAMAQRAAEMQRRAELGLPALAEKPAQSATTNPQPASRE